MNWNMGIATSYLFKTIKMLDVGEVDFRSLLRVMICVLHLVPVLKYGALN